MGLPGLFHTSPLISVTLGPRSPAWESVINEGFVNMSTVGCRGAASFDFQRVPPRGTRGARVWAKMFSIHCHLFPSIMYFYGSRMTFIFHPQHLVIINSSLIPLCWLRVTPYLPLNTLSPINIFQIFPDTICGIQMKPSQRLPAPRRLGSARSEWLSLKFVLSHTSFLQE